MSAPLSEEQIVRYLLGNASEEEVATLEGHLFREPSYFDAVAAVEDSLIMQYLCGKLQARWLPLFEEAYLKSEARRARVESARILRQAVGEACSSRVSWWHTLKTSPSSWQVAVLVPALAVLVFGFGWVVWKNSKQRNPPIVANHIAFRLKPGLQRSGQPGEMPAPQQLSWSSEIHEVYLGLELSSLPAYQAYRAVVGTPERPAAWSGPLAMQDGILTAKIPSAVLSLGDYTLQFQGVTSNSNTETIDTYYFRVTK